MRIPPPALSAYKLANTSVAALAAVLFFSAGGSSQASDISVKRDRSSATYKKGETPSFHIVGDLPEKDLKWTLLRDGKQPVAEGSASLVSGSAIITPANLDTSKPGFLLLSVVTPSAKAPILRGIAIDPLEIRAGLPVPEDFDTFWTSQKEELAKIAPNIRLEAVPFANLPASLELFDIRADAVGSAPVSGYLARPRDAKPKSLPAILTLHGAGVRSSLAHVAIEWAEKGFIALDINAHGIANGETPEFYKNLEQNDLKDYRRSGRESRENIYFRTMFLRVLRAIDVLAEQPEWDGKTLIVFGSSQGGAQAIVAGALDPRVTLVVAGVPAMCDHGGALVNRVAGWPKMVSHLPDGTPDPAVVKTAGYYDMASFATRVKAPTYFTVGFIDTTCPPSSVYAAYNALPGKKAIFDDIPSGHANTTAAKAWMKAAILEHAQLPIKE